MSDNSKDLKFRFHKFNLWCDNACIYWNTARLWGKVPLINLFWCTAIGIHLNSNNLYWTFHMKLFFISLSTHMLSLMDWKHHLVSIRFNLCNCILAQYLLYRISFQHRLEPSGTPHSKGQGADQESPSRTIWDLTAKKEWHHCKAMPLIHQSAQDSMVNGIKSRWEVQQGTHSPCLVSRLDQVVIHWHQALSAGISSESNKGETMRSLPLVWPRPNAMWFLPFQNCFTQWPWYSNYSSFPLPSLYLPCANYTIM